MPELPEVEIIRRGLEKRIVGKIIKDLQVLYPKGVQFDPQKVSGKKVLEVWRRAKMIGINLTGDQSLLFHLKMTGQLIYVDGGERLIGGHPTPDMRDEMPNKTTVAIFTFSDNAHLFFNDMRRFGWIKLVEGDKRKVISDKLFEKLGPEPLEKDFSWEILKNNLLRHPKLPVKVALMGQSAVAGIGNIYASEILFLARIDPRRAVKSLSDAEFKKIYESIIKALQTAIQAGGSTRANFVNIDGERGYFLDYANVYGKEGYPCQSCKGKVVKIQQAGRGTYFCEHCQK